MEDTRYNLRQVHVLRQGFRPNQPLGEAFASLFVSDAFSLYGTDEKIIDASLIGSRVFNAQLNEANHRLGEASHSFLHLQPSTEDEKGIAARVIQKKGQRATALQLIMTPEDEPALHDTLDAFDAIHAGTRDFALGFQATKIYMTVPIENLLPFDLVRERLAKMNQALGAQATRHLYQVSPLPRFAGHFDQRLVFEPEELPYPHTRAS